MTDSSSLEEAIRKILQDKNFLSSIPQSSSSSPTKRKNEDPSPSPIKLKKVRLSTSEIDALSQGEFSARSPNETSETGSNEGAGNSSGSDSDINVLEHLLAGQNDYEQEEEEEDEDDLEEGKEGDDGLSIIGGPPEASWSLSPKIMNFYKKVSDIELKKEDCDKLKDSWKPTEEESSHFEPPKLPQTLWQTISSNSPADFHRAKTIYKAQDYIYLALRPILSSIESSKDKDLRSNLCSAVQLLCSSNLLLNRYRRASVSYHLKPDLRKQVLSLPVKHDSLFGGDFDKTADNIVKEQSVLSKVMQPKKQPIQQRLGSKPQGQARPPFLQNSRKNFRGKGKSGRGFYSKNRGFRAQNDSASEGGVRGQGPTSNNSSA